MQPPNPNYIHRQLEKRMKHYTRYIPFKPFLKRFIKCGATRWTILIGRYAVKIPSLYSYRQFLNGLLGNHQERTFYQIKDWQPKLCPVLWCSWLCVVLVMPRARILTQDEDVDLEKFIQVGPEFYKIPAEIKADSFGYLGDRLVAVDYGS